MRIRFLVRTLHAAILFFKCKILIKWINISENFQIQQDHHVKMKKMAEVIILYHMMK